MRGLATPIPPKILFIRFIQVKTLPLPVGEEPGVRGAPTPVIVGASVAASALTVRVSLTHRQPCGKIQV